jgi:anti-sigma-K factor RskA
MWVIPKGGSPKPAGMFRSTDSGTAFHMLAGSQWLSTGDAIAVTIEPEAGSIAPTTTPLFVQAI